MVWKLSNGRNEGGKVDDSSKQAPASRLQGPVSPGGSVNTSASRFRTRLAVIAGLTLVLSAAFGAVAGAATKVWNNAAGGPWTTAGNWTPSGAPVAGDVIQFGSGGTFTVTAVPALSIQQLLVSNGSAVTLQAGAASTLTIVGGTGTDLSVPAGTQLNVSGANVLIIALSSSVTGSIGGAMTFSGAAHRLDAAGVSAVTFGSGATFTQGTGCTGNVFTSAGTANVILFTSGSSFIQLAGANPYGLAAPNSKVNFQSGSLFAFRQNSAPSFSNRTCADFEIDFAAYNRISTGADPFTCDNFTMTSGAAHLQLANVVIKGDLSVAAGATLDFNPTAAATVSLSGTSTQTVNSSGTLTFNSLANLTINNPSGIMVQSAVTLPGTTTVNAGALLAAAAPLTNSGTTTVNGTLRIDTGGSISVAPTYGGNSTLIYNAPDGLGVGLEWSGTDGVAGAGVPQHVTVQQGAVTMPAASRTVPGNLTFDGGGMALTSGDLSVMGVLALGASRITTAGSKVVLPSGASLTRTGGGYVVGTLQRAVPAGASAPTFEIGDTASYTPVALSFGSGTGAGDIAAGVTASDQPNLGSSMISQTRRVRRYWTVTNGGVTGTYDATFHFVGGDVQGGADPGIFIVGEYGGGAWSYPTVGTRTSTSTEILGASGAGDFAIGQTTGRTITASAGPGGSIDPAGEVSVVNGGSIAFTIASAEGYHLDSLYVDEVPVTPVSPYEFTNVTAAHTIRATFAINSYAISSSAGPHGGISPAPSVSVNHGADQSFAITPDTGYQVDSLIVDGTAVAADTNHTFTNVTTSHTIRATFMVDEAAATANAETPPYTISPNHPTVTVPVRISRTGSSPARAFSVTVRLSSHLVMPAGVGSITEGDFLGGGGRTTGFQASDLGDGLYRVDGTVVDGPCGSDRTLATLFEVALSSPAASALDTLTVVGWSLSTCDGSKLPAIVGAAAEVRIDQAAPAVALTAPNGGQFWAVDSPLTITWTASDDVAVAGVDLAYSTDGGATYPDTIATGIANSGSYGWTVPNALSTTVRVRVTAHDVNGNSAGDASDADFTIGLYALTASAGAHGSISPPSALVAHGASQPYTITPDPGYHVDSLTVDGLPVPVVLPFSLTGVQADHVVHVTFAINTFTIAASAGAHGTIDPSGEVVVDFGSDQAFTISPATGYHLDSLIVDGSPVAPATSHTFTNVTADHAIHATFAINTYTVVASAGTHGSIDPSGPVSVDHGSDLGFALTPDPGYHLDSLLVDGLPVTPATSYTISNVTADHTVHAAFAINDFTILATSGSHGLIRPQGTVGVGLGENQGFTFTPDPGYHVDSLYVDGAPVPPAASYTFTNLASDHTIHVTFAINTYSIVASAGAHGAIDPSGPVPVNHGSDLGFTLTPDLGYHVDSLYVDGVPVTPATSHSFTNVTTNHTIHATFAIDVFTISASAGPHGGIDPGGPVPVNYGADQGFTIAPATGYHVDSLYVDGVPVTPATSHSFTNVTTNHTIHATFAIDVFSISASAGPHGAIEPSGAVTVEYGGSQAFSLMPDPGYHVDSLFVDEVSVPAAASYTFTNVQAGHAIRATFAVNPAVPAITLLTATQRKTGNGTAPITGITLGWPAVGEGATVEIYRAGFGNYPEYDDGAMPGSVPPLPTTYPPDGRWVPVDSVAAPGTSCEDLPPVRDFYYHVAIVTDRYGTHSTVSNMTTGTLNYHLGDVVDPADSLLAGDDQVNLADLSLLGAHYGTSLVPGSPYSALDVGPTADYSPNTLPTTDNMLDFEDLVVFAMNYARVSAPQASMQAVAAARDELLIESVDRVAAGREVLVSLRLRGTGAVQGLATRLSWDPEVVTPVRHGAGALAESQRALVLSPRPGAVDAAVLGAGAGFRGEGVVATVTFRALRAGDPKIRLASANARDPRNRKVSLVLSESAVKLPPSVTQLAPASPNPFRQSATLAFSLAQSGPVELAVFSVDGRRVRTLVRESREPGEYRVNWDGRDDRGNPMSAGVYYARLKAAQRGFTRTLTYLR
jgi:hypothetical protein